MLALQVVQPFHMPLPTGDGEMMEPRTVLTPDEAAIVRMHPHLVARCIQISYAAVANIESLTGKRENPPSVAAHVAANAPAAPATPAQIAAAPAATVEPK
jgi:hypothetical protein